LLISAGVLAHHFSALPRGRVEKRSRAKTMKTRDFDMSPSRDAVPSRRERKADGVPGFGLALLGGACAIGVFAVLAVLFNLG
jgi:hypothetical protein